MTDDRRETPRTSLDPAAGGRHAAPGTTRDAAPAPGTTRDAAPGLPGTTRDGAPGTTRDGAPGTTRDGAPGTTRDGEPAPGPRAGGGFIRVNLPPELEARFTPVRELGAGGEADLLLVDDRAGRGQFVVRLYRHQDIPFDTAKLDRLRAADRRHLIGLLDYGQGHGYSWEILEYAAHGSLEELIRTRTPIDVLQVFDQVSAAIGYANDQGMVHRDIKPGNILVRSREPLDLVLADFGLTRFLTATRNMGTTSRTSAYAPPEAASGESSRASDWWSLGVMLVELITGLNPFQRPDGSWQDDRMILNHLLKYDIDVSGVTDPRWNLLCRGLLTRDPRKRWGARQTAEWRAGGSPAVDWAAPATDRPRRAGGGTFVFAGVGYDDPLTLAAALRANWGEGRRLMAGRAMSAPNYLAFRDWLLRQDLNDAVRMLDGGAAERPERGLLQVILALDPDSPPEFNGHRLDLEHLHDLATGATQFAGEARQVLDVVYAEGLLTVCDGLPGCPGYAMLDDRWHRAVEYADARLAHLSVPVAPADHPAMVAQLLITSFEGQQEVFGEAARNALADPHAQGQPWFAALGSELTPGAYVDVLHAVIMVSQPQAAQQTVEQMAEAERRRVWEEQQRIQEQRARINNISPVLGIVLGLVSCAPILGLITGPAAIYFGVRARRTVHTAASTWAIALGGIGVFVTFCYLSR